MDLVISIVFHVLSTSCFKLLNSLLSNSTCSAQCWTSLCKALISCVSGEHFGINEADESKYYILSKMQLKHVHACIVPYRQKSPCSTLGCTLDSIIYSTLYISNMCLHKYFKQHTGLYSLLPKTYKAEEDITLTRDIIICGINYYHTNFMLYLYPGTRLISLLLHESEAEPRTSTITMISSEYTGYNYFMSQCVGV